MALSDHTEELRWLESSAKENGERLNFFTGLWGYKEVACFLGVSQKTVLSPAFRRHLPAVALWQAEGTKQRSGRQVLRWRPLSVIEFRNKREQEAIRRLRAVG